MRSDPILITKYLAYLPLFDAHLGEKNRFNLLSMLDSIIKNSFARLSPVARDMIHHKKNTPLWQYALLSLVAVLPFLLSC